MNCQKFQEMLFEYVEGSLTESERAEADSHLAACPVCARVVQRETNVQERLHKGLQQSVESLTLGSQGRAELLGALASERVVRQRPWPRRLTDVWLRLGAALGASVALAALVIWVRQPQTSPQKAERSGGSVSAQVSAAKPTIQIRLPGIATSYTFQQNGEYVVDTFVEQATAVNVTLWNPGGEPAESKDKERKLPL